MAMAGVLDLEAPSPHKQAQGPTTRRRGQSLPRGAFVLSFLPRLVMKVLSRLICRFVRCSAFWYNECHSRVDQLVSPSSTLNGG